MLFWVGIFVYSHFFYDHDMSTLLPDFVALGVTSFLSITLAAFVFTDALDYLPIEIKSTSKNEHLDGFAFGIMILTLIIWITSVAFYNKEGFLSLVLKAIVFILG